MDLICFLIDQGLHLAVLVYAWTFFDWRPNPVFLNFSHHLFPSKAVMVFQQSQWAKTGLNGERFLAGAIVYILVCFGGAVLVRKILNIVANTSSPVNARQKVGATIGLAERLIILTLVLNDALGSIAFILTAKSIARFSELNDRQFAEYYLIGTLTSTAIAICGGLFLKYLMIHF